MVPAAVEGGFSASREESDGGEGEFREGLPPRALEAAPPAGRDREEQLVVLSVPEGGRDIGPGVPRQVLLM